MVAYGTSFAANGARSFYEQISYDGTSVIQQRSNNGAPPPIIDAIQEFKIQTGNYSAEYGGNAGANVQVQIRSGTNRLHGSGWDFLRPFPTLGEIRMWASDGNSNYNAMQVQYEHRFGHGLSATASFTWSHLIDDQGSNLNGSRAQTQDPRCSRCNMRADSANDVRNRLVAG